MNTGKHTSMYMLRELFGLIRDGVIRIVDILKLRSFIISNIRQVLLWYNWITNYV